MCVVVQIETRGALRELEAMAAVPGVDALLIGPSDLSADFGHLGNPGHPEVQAAIGDACARCKKIRKPLGIFAPVEVDARRYLDLGVDFAIVGVDAAVLRRGADALRQMFSSSAP